MKRFLILTLCLALGLAACAAQPAATEASAPKTPQALQPTPVSTALFQVIKPDGSIFSISWDDLKKLPLASLTVDGKVEEGVKLSDVLTAAGITEYIEVSLSGSASPVTLTHDQVDDNTILDFTNRGTVKLSSTYVPKPEWTKDISEIKVK